MIRFFLTILFVTVQSFVTLQASAANQSDEAVADMISGKESVKIKKQKELSVLQDQIAKCFPKLEGYKSVKAFKDLYTRLDKQFILLNETTLAAEVIYKSNDQVYKLKVDNNKISWYEIADDGTAQIKQFDAKQKVTTVRGKIKQMTLNTQIQEEWADYAEKRENGLSIEYSVRQGEMTKIKVVDSKNKHELNCEKKSAVEVCFCSF